MKGKKRIIYNIFDGYNMLYETQLYNIILSVDRPKTLRSVNFRISHGV